MANLVIVAIPSEDDYVWKISSEKKPHMTLLFLGDVEGKPVLKIQEFLEHAVNILELRPFGAEVDYRGTLGVDEADVLFFRQDWSMKRVDEFRGQLLKFEPIWKAYNSTSQFGGPQEWTPHLTLGYPETPAKKDNRDFPGIRWVDFDRIALWYGDFEGPEWRLTFDHDLAEVSMSAQAGEEFISHYGVKGMKWGVRKRRDHTPREVTVDAVVKNSGKAKLKAKGGSHHPPSVDAAKAEAQRQILKKSGIHALTNKELQELATRMNLEQQVTSLESKRPKSAGKEFTENLVRDPHKTARSVKEVSDTAANIATILGQRRR